MSRRQIFISYSFGDRSEYGNLTDVLLNLKLPYLKVSATPGLLLRDELCKNVSECEVCIFICTEQSLASGWCQAEVGAFWGAGKPVIVCIVDRKIDPSKLPPQFVGVTWTESYTEAAKAAEKLLALSRPYHNIVQLQGHRLFQYPDYYPVDLEVGTNLPIVNRQRFGEAVEHLLEDVYDPMAATDLVYLRIDNISHFPDILPDSHKAKYKDLLKKYGLEDFTMTFEQEKRRIFRNYIKLVEDIGETFKDVYFEILLHDVRNPIRSIIACKNTEGISGRRLYDPSTRFVVQYIKNQGKDLFAAMEQGSKVAYLKQFTKTKKVKATTTPVFDDRYGLVGILCMNIDIDAIKKMDDKMKYMFFNNYTWNTGKTPEFEK